MGEAVLICQQACIETPHTFYIFLLQICNYFNFLFCPNLAYLDGPKFLLLLLLVLFITKIGGERGESSSFYWFTFQMTKLLVPDWAECGSWKLYVGLPLE